MVKKRKLRGVHALVGFLVILIIIQIIVFFIIFKRMDDVQGNLVILSDELNEKIDMNNKGVQSKFNSVSDAISELGSSQTGLEQELGELKAKTSADFSGIIEQEIQGVVTIKTNAGQGTGFLISDDGYVVTNAHVLSGASFADIHTYDSKIYSAALVGYDADMDIALLKVDGGFSSLELGDSNDVKIGEKVIAIGNPLGLSFTATEGIISAKDRAGINGLSYYFQTDVALNPGNSGGPLLNTEGEVIGINNFKISGADNIGFALEINYAVDVINDISSMAINQTIL